MTVLVVIVWQDVPLPGMLLLLSSLSLLCIRAGEGLIPEKPLSSSSSSSSDTMAQNKKLIKRIVWPWHILTCCSFHRRLTLNTVEGKNPYKVFFFIWQPYQERQNTLSWLKTWFFSQFVVVVFVTGSQISLPAYFDTPVLQVDLTSQGSGS